MKNKKLFLKNVASASVPLASKFYTTKMTKLKVISKVLLITLKNPSASIQHTHTISPWQKQAPPSPWHPSCHPTPVIWRMLRKYALHFLCILQTSRELQGLHATHESYNVHSILSSQSTAPWFCRHYSSTAGYPKNSAPLQPHSPAAQASAQLHSLGSSEAEGGRMDTDGSGHKELASCKIIHLYRLSTSSNASVTGSHHRHMAVLHRLASSSWEGPWNGLP